MDSPRILVIEDDEAHRRLLAKALEPDGFAVETAASGEEGLERLRASAFSVVLCDLAMPGMGGLRTLKAIKAAFPALPVIIITGQATVDTAVEAMQSGASEYLRKPFDLRALVAAIRKATGLS